MIKKFIASLVLISLICALLSSCGRYKKGKTFSTEFLKTVSLENMPLPASRECALNSQAAGVEALKIKTDISEFEDYINLFIKYMNAREDIYYFGIQKNEGLIAEMLPHRVAYVFDGEFKWTPGTCWYTFAYSLTDGLDDRSACSGHTQYKDPVIVKFEYDQAGGFALIRISKNAALASACMDDGLFISFSAELDQ